jgi:transglutaminase-like putative cysteine protease
VLLGLCVIGLAWDFPVLVPLALAVGGVGAVAVVMQGRWRRALVPELLLCVALGWFWMARGAALADAGVAAQLGFLILAACAWLLLTAPPGYRHLILIPVGVALVLPTGPGCWLVLAAAVAAMAEDGWRGRSSPVLRRGLAARAAWWRWTPLPVVLVGAVVWAVVMLGPSMAGPGWAGALSGTERDGGHRVGPVGGPPRGHPVSGAPLPDPGPAPAERARDGTVVARWLDHGDAVGGVYLRALACDDLRLENGDWRWRLPDPALARPVVAEVPAGSWSRLLCLDAGMVVLRPDAAPVVELPGLLGDEAGNRWRDERQTAARIYRVAPGHSSVASSALLARCRRLPEGAAALLAGPQDNPAAAPVATWRALDAETAATAIIGWMQARSHYRIGTLDDPPGGEGLWRFLWARTPIERSGDCRHFTTAMVLALRAAGHPARAVTGFLSDERVGSAVVFRIRHAHAWVEVVGHDGAWVRVDPTPTDERHAELAAHPVVDPTPETVPSSGPDGMPAVSLTADTTIGVQGSAWLLAVGGAGGGMVVVLVVRWWWRRTRPQVRRVRELARSEQDIVRLATTLGIVVTPGMTLTAVCSAVTMRTGIDLSSQLAAHLAARYGAGPLPPPWPEAALRAAHRRQ